MLLWCSNTSATGQRFDHLTAVVTILRMSPTVPSRPIRGRTLGRRGLLMAGAGGVVAATAGCTLNNPFDTDRTPAAEAIDDLAPDVALAVTAVGALLATDARAALALETFPALRSRLAGVRELHTAHLRALRDAVPDGVDPAPQTAAPTPPATRAAALKGQNQAERALHDQLVGLALRAESGPFARLLGTMAAAISQQLAAQPLVGGAR